MAEQIIDKKGYYNLINGYKFLFLDTNSSPNNEIYKCGSKFSEIHELYKFDRELRVILFRYILEIESDFKAKVVNIFSKNYGHKEYCKIENFKYFRSDASKLDDKKVKNILKTFDKIDKELNNQKNKKGNPIMHYNDKYKYVPLWVIINYLSFGTVSNFYKNMKDKNDVSKKYGLKSNELESIIKLLTIVRNKCAHDERIYCSKFDKIVGENKRSNIFIVSEVICKLLQEESKNAFIEQLASLFDSIEGKFNTITKENILGQMGFHNEWIISIDN